MDFGKGALVFTSFAIHMHSVTISSKGYFLGHGYRYKNNGKGNGYGNDDANDNGSDDKDDAVKAFLIIAFLLYLVAFLLQVISKIGEDLKLSSKIIGIILFILLILAGHFLHLQL